MVPGNLRVLTQMATPRRYTDPDYMLEVGPDIYGGQLRLDRDAARRARRWRCAPPPARGYLYQLLAGRRLDQLALAAADCGCRC